jgi:hypothetical protein
MFELIKKNHKTWLTSEYITYITANDTCHYDNKCMKAFPLISNGILQC